jgi:Glycine-zipper domain
MTSKKSIQAAVLSLALMVPAANTFAYTHYKTTHHVYRHRHHYSQTRGAVVGAVAGAVIDHRHPLTGALIGAAVGDGVQVVRNHKQ